MTIPHKTIKQLNTIAQYEIHKINDASITKKVKQR